MARSAEALKLVQYLTHPERVASGETLLSQQCGTTTGGNQGPPGDENSWDGWPDYLFALTGEYPAMIGADLRVAAGSEQSVDPLPQLKTWYDNHGMLPYLSHHGPPVPLKVRYISPSWHIDPSGITAPDRHALISIDDDPIEAQIAGLDLLEKVLTPGTPEHTAAWTVELTYVQRVKANFTDHDIPVIARYPHEMNLPGWWWTVGRNSAALHAEWCRAIRDFWEMNGVNNCVWVWSPEHPFRVFANSNAFEGDLASCYPGDDYVDVVGYDIYHGFNPVTGAWKTMRSGGPYSLPSMAADAQFIAKTSAVDAVLEWDFDHMATIAPNKPFAATETDWLWDPTSKTRSLVFQHAWHDQMTNIIKRYGLTTAPFTPTGPSLAAGEAWLTSIYTDAKAITADSNDWATWTPTAVEPTPVIRRGKFTLDVWPRGQAAIVDPPPPDDAPPVAGFTVDPTTGTTSTEFTVTDTSTEGDAALSSLSLDWGDGTVEAIAEGGTETNTYLSAGVKTITLTVTDANGLVDTHVDTVAITPPVDNDLNSRRGACVYPDYFGVAYNGTTYVEPSNPNTSAILGDPAVDVSKKRWPELLRFEAMIGDREFPYVQQFSPFVTKAGSQGASDTAFVSAANQTAVRNEMAAGCRAFANNSSAEWNMRWLHARGATLVITIPLSLRVTSAATFESPYATLAQAAAGQLNSVFSSIANWYRTQLDTAGNPMSRIIWRIGWEANTKSHPYSPKFPNGGTEVPGRIDLFKQAFAACVSTFKTNGLSSWKYQFDLDMYGYGLSSGNGSQGDRYYPGDTYVDIVGITFYDAMPTSQGGYPGGTVKTDADRLQHWQNVLPRFNAMKTWVNNHTTKALQIALPEWGCSWAGNPITQPVPGITAGGDNPVLIEQLLDWVDALPAAQFAYHSYFNKWGDFDYFYGTTKLTPRYAVNAAGDDPADSDFPRAAAEYATRIGD